jgi:hypothetical protein
MLANQPERRPYAAARLAVGCLCACENPVCPEDHVAPVRPMTGEVRPEFVRPLPERFPRTSLWRRDRSDSPASS